MYPAAFMTFWQNAVLLWPSSGKAVFLRILATIVCVLCEAVPSCPASPEPWAWTWLTPLLPPPLPSAPPSLPLQSISSPLHPLTLTTRSLLLLFHIFIPVRLNLVNPPAIASPQRWAKIKYDYKYYLVSDLWPNTKIIHLFSSTEYKNWQYLDNQLSSNIAMNSVDN